MISCVLDVIHGGESSRAQQHTDEGAGGKINLLKYCLTMDMFWVHVKSVPRLEPEL